MEATRKRILLAVDGSAQSYGAVHYVINAFSEHNTEVVLFNVTTKIEKAFWSMGINPGICDRIVNIKAWEVELDKAMRRFMNDSRQALLDAGFAPEAVTIDIHQSKAGVARDIAEESRGGYDAVVLGRNGLNTFKDFVFGSVARKLIDKLAHLPVWIVGAKPQLGKVLVAVDASKWAMRVVDHVVDMLAHTDLTVTLLHVIRGVDMGPLIDMLPLADKHKYLTPSLQEEWLDEAKGNIAPTFSEAKNRLINAGLDPNRVTTKVITAVSSRAGGVVDEAREGGYGTIIVGRRGMSDVKEFFVGSVCNKVLHLATEMAVCVVA